MMTNQDRCKPAAGRWTVAFVWTLAVMAVCTLGSGVFAQTVEQNRARILPGDRITALPGSITEVTGLDATPLGVALAGIVLVSDSAAVRDGANAKGIVIQSENPNLTDPALRQVLARFIGQPLSQRLIGEVRDAITNHMRARNRPLVAVIIPPQEVTSGSVQLLVVPFTLGEKRVERVANGHESTSDAYVLQTVRAQPGEEIVSDKLLADINWLNLNPFRSVEVLFQPGSIVGTTDMHLRLTDKRPLQVYAGYANSGTSATGSGRVFAGFSTASAAFGDQQFAYQVTAAPGTVYTDGREFDFTADSAYLAHSVGYFAPLPWRHKLTLRGDYTRSRADLVDPLVQDNATWQIGLDYAVPVLHANPSLDMFGGFEFKQQQNEVFFDDVSIKASTIDVVQGVLGVRGEVSTKGLRTGFDLKGVFSPGGLTANNTDTAFAAASGTPSDRAQYAYILGKLTHSSALPKDLALNLTFSGQLAAQSLPAMEQFAIGGMRGVRGYEAGERSGDNGFLLQAELRLPKFSLLQRAGVFDQTSPYAFADYGLVHAITGDKTHSLLGAGLGVDVNVSDHLQAQLVWGHAFLAGATTTAHSNRLHASMVASY